MNSDYPASPHLPVNECLFILLTKDADDGSSIYWGCSVDDRGIHIIYSNPDLNKEDFIYHHKQEDDIDEASYYAALEINKLSDNGYRIMTGNYAFHSDTFLLISS